MSEMVERVARAIAERDRNPADDDEWDQLKPWVQDAFREDARAAIAAMREPTDAMISEAMAERDCYYSIYTAMIDAALED